MQMLDRMRCLRLTHPDAHVSLCNRSAALLRTGDPAAALVDAEQAMDLVLAGGVRIKGSLDAAAKCLLRKSQALAALGRVAEAVEELQQALRLSPSFALARKELQRLLPAVATEEHIGGQLIARAPALGPIEPYQASVPMDRLRAESRSLGNRVLTPAAAVGSPELKDLLTYLQIETDVRRPRQLLEQLNDTRRLELFGRAIQERVLQLESDDRVREGERRKAESARLP